MGKIVILRQHPNPFHCRFIYSHSLFNHEVTLTCLCNLDISIFFLLTWYQQHLVSRSKGAALILLPTPNSSRICQIETLHLACITLKNPCMPRCSWVTRLSSSSKRGVSFSVGGLALCRSPAASNKKLSCVMCLWPWDKQTVSTRQRTSTVLISK